MLNRAFWGNWLILPAKYGLQENFGNRPDFAALRTEASFLHYTTNTKPWRAAWVPPIIQADKKLWMDTLRNATAAYNLTASELTQGIPGERWDVVKYSGAV